MDISLIGDIERTNNKRVAALAEWEPFVNGLWSVCMEWVYVAIPRKTSQKCSSGYFRLWMELVFSILCIIVKMLIEKNWSKWWFRRRLSNSTSFCSRSEIPALCPVVSLSSHFDGGCPCESGLPVFYSCGGTVAAELAATNAPKPMLIHIRRTRLDQYCSTLDFHISNAFMTFTAQQIK